MSFTEPWFSFPFKRSPMFLLKPNRPKKHAGPASLLPTTGHPRKEHAGAAGDLFAASFSVLAAGKTYCGVEGNLLATLRWQHSGGRLIAVARPSEARSMHVKVNVCFCFKPNS